MLALLDRISLLLMPLAWLALTALWTLRHPRGSAGAPRPARTRLERAFPLLWGAWVAVPTGLALLPEPCLGGCLWEPGGAAARGLGWGFGVAGLALAALGSWALGASWRIGVDTQAPGPLVTRGVYRVTRNPVAGGMLVGLLGLVVWVPAPPTVALLAASAVVLAAQVRREERDLARRFGAAYEAYCARTGRWMPQLTRA